MVLEIEIRSADSRNAVYELRNLLQQDGSDLQIHIKEQAPQQGEMAIGLIEPVLVGVIEGLVGHSMGDIYSKILKPKISQWIKTKKSMGHFEVLSTLKDQDTRVHFLEDNQGKSEVFENLKYAIDIDHTRAVLIGNSEYDYSFNAIPPVKGNVEDFYHLLTDKLHVGLPPENIVVAFNKTNTEIEEILLHHSRIPQTETLIIYFAGHGHRTDVKKLYLVARNTKRIDDYLIGGIDFDFVSNVVLRNATAKQKILILDACHSGIATQGTDDLLGRLDVKGSYILASSPGDEVSYFEKSSRNTYFTGVLLDVIKTGIENTSEMIALDDMYEYCRTHLSEKNFPHPIYKNELNIPPSNFFIARNPKFSFERLKQRPEKLFSDGNYEDALYEYRMLLQRFPDDMELRQKAAVCETNALFVRMVRDGDELFYHVKDYLKAAEKYRKALQIKDDALVRSKLGMCQDYLRKPTTEETQKLQEKPLVLPVIKEEKKSLDEKQQEKNKEGFLNADPPKKLAATAGDQRTGILLASVWLALTLVLVFSLMDDHPVHCFYMASIPAFVVAIGLIVFRRKNITTTEMLLLAHGVFFCLFPLVVSLTNGDDTTSNAILLLLVYDLAYVIFLVRMLKKLKLADIIIASIEILYLPIPLLSIICYSIYKSDYGERQTASSVGLYLGIAIGLFAVLLTRQKWLRLRKKPKGG